MGFIPQRYENLKGTIGVKLMGFWGTLFSDKTKGKICGTPSSTSKVAGEISFFDGEATTFTS